jgi:hypothetical protein
MNILILLKMIKILKSIKKDLEKIMKNIAKEIIYLVIDKLKNNIDFLFLISF